MASFVMGDLSELVLMQEWRKTSILTTILAKEEWEQTPSEGVNS